MNGCSLEVAFPSDGPGAPGCNSNGASKEARREEKRKAKRCKGPQMEFLNWGQKDPDRQALEKTPDVPPMNRETGLREHTPVTAPQGDTEPFVDIIGKQQHPYKSDQPRIAVVEESPRNDGDPRGDYMRSSLTITPGQTEQPVSTVKRAKFFGADGPSEGFADYKPDANNYLLEPDFTRSFNYSGVGKAGSGDGQASATNMDGQFGLALGGGSPVVPAPSVSDYWKPLTKSGSNTAFYSSLPYPGGVYSDEDREDSNTRATVSTKVINQKLDQIFARLDELGRGGSAEQGQMEVMMFISAGVFVLFAMDMFLKRGASLRG
jgi:hypothetical protein